MKWFFALNADTMDHHDHDWDSMIKAAVCSARRNTWLQPHFIFDGPPSTFTRDLERLGVKMIYHRVSLYEKMQEQGPKFPMAISAGSYLRIDIPLLEPEEDFVLYTDCDVIFRKQPAVMRLRPQFFACVPQTQRGSYEDMNSGVMLINVKAMRRELPGFSRYIVENLSRLGNHDQTALIEYFSGRYDLLPDELNWKSYWGVNDAAEIVHFHGPKPGAVLKVLADPSYPMYPVWRKLMNRDISAYQQTVAEWEGYLHQVQHYLAA